MGRGAHGESLHPSRVILFPMVSPIRNRNGERLAHVFTPPASPLAPISPGANEGLRKLAIIGHGVTSHHDRPYFVRLCEAFARAGIASVRFSFAGNGASEGRFEDATITKEVQDLGCVLDAFPEYAPIYIGHSMGGAVGVLRAARDARLKALVSLAGMVHVQAFMERVFGHLRPERDLMLEREGCPLTQRFLDDARGIGSLVETGAALRLPFLLVHGSADELVPIEDSRDVHAGNGTTELVELAGVDHRFTDHIEDMVEAVTGWVAKLPGRPGPG